MSSNPIKGALDRNAWFPRVAYRFSTTRNPANNYSMISPILYLEGQSNKNFECAADLT